MSAPPLITLLTDFGSRDVYVAAMKGVILGINPRAGLVDLTHEVPPQDIVTGAFLLAEAAWFFPPGTIHLAVVDPGVGTSRRALGAYARGHYWVGPDNGLFYLVFREAEAMTLVSLENSAYFRHPVSATFHGRDLFAPVAAHLSLGVPLTAFGPLIHDPVPLPWPAPRFALERVEGEIIYVDGFGNLVSNLKGGELLAWLDKAPFTLTLGSLKLSCLSQTYGDRRPGEFLALVGSHGYLEVALAKGNAARRLGVGKGSLLEIRKMV
jgi:S-adenosylmethionine hydrolase|uniref:SAM-dependent chlorinase/fluorinase n=1 Tax=Desulfobacca acetoxidans TaxID=60893 RepID=A0A7V6A2J9_9BACT